MPFTLPAPTAQGFTGQNPPIWANFLAIANFLNTNMGQPATVITTAGAFSFTQPVGSNFILVEVQAPGGGTGTLSGGLNPGGGGGGEWIRTRIPCPTGTVVTGTLGAASAGVAGGDCTVVIGTYTITVQGGRAPTGANNTTGGAGGGRKGPAGTGQGNPPGAGVDGVAEGVDSISGASATGAPTAVNTNVPIGGSVEENKGGVAFTGNGVNLPGANGGAAKCGPGGSGVLTGNAVQPTGFGGGAAGMAGNGTVGCPGGPGFICLIPQ